MATPPTFVSENESAWNSSTAPKTTTSFNGLLGDIIAALAAEANEDGTETITLSISSGEAVTKTESSGTADADGQAAAGTTTLTADRTGATFTSNITGGGVDFNGVNATVWRSSDGVGNVSTTANLSGGPSWSFTTNFDNSAILAVFTDWNAADGTTRTWRTVNGITPSAGNSQELTYFRDSIQYTVYIAYWSDAGAAGAKTIGLSAPTGQDATAAAIEIRGSAAAAGVPPIQALQQWPPASEVGGPWPRPQIAPLPSPDAGSFSGDSTLTVTDAITADGRTEGQASLTETAAITTSDRTEGGASLSETATITASGQAQGAASLSATATITASGRIEGSAALNVSATITPADRTEGSASLTETATITAAGSPPGTLNGTASLTETASITAAGRAEGAASLTETATVTASGRAEGPAALTGTVTITPGGETRGAASLAETASITAAGQAQGSGARSTTASITAAGRAEGSAARTATATITAAGNMSATGAASLPVGAVITAVGHIVTGDTAITRVSTGSRRQRASTEANRQRVSTGNRRQRITTEIG